MSEPVWFYVEGGSQQGPVTAEHLKEALRSRLPRATLVWREGFPEWIPASEVNDLQTAPRVPPPPPPRSIPPRPAVHNPWTPPGAAGPRAAAWGDEEPTYNPFVLWGRCFSWGGRFNRGEFAIAYFGQVMVTWIVFFMVGMGASMAGAKSEGATMAVGALAILWFVFSLVLSLGAAVRRLHDLGQSGWLVLLMVVPCVNLALIVYLLAAPGKVGEAAASSGASTAVIVAVALAVLAVPMIGIIAAIAIPSLLRARVSANEAGAIGDLRTVVSAEAAYQASNRGFYEGRGECLSRPAECIPGYSGPSFLDPMTLTSPKNGYMRELRPGTPIEPGLTGVSPTSTNGFAIIAYPAQPGQTGVRSFCADASGRVCSMMGNASALVEEDAQAGGVRCATSCMGLN